MSQAAKAEAADGTPESRASTEAVDWIVRLGFAPPEPPEVAQPEWPENVADLSDHELGRHMACWTAWMGYAGYQVALADSERRAFEAQEKFSEVQVMLKGMVATEQDVMDAELDENRKMTDAQRRYYLSVTRQKAKALQDADVQHAAARHLAHTARYKLLQAIYADLEQKYVAISREISRRGGQHDAERRTT